MADTDIELTVGFDTKDVRQKSKELRDDFKKAFDSTDTSKLDAKQRQLLSTMSKVGRESEKVEKEMAKLAEQRIPTQKYTQLERSLTKIESESSKVIKQMRQMEAAGETSNKKYQQLAQTMETLEKESERVQSNIDTLKDSGQAFTMGDASQKFADLENKQANLTNQMTVLQAKAKDAGIAVGSIGEQSSKGIQVLIDQLLKLRFNIEEPKTAIDALKLAWNGVPSIMYTALTGINKAAHAIGSGLVNAVRGAASAMAQFAKSAGIALWNGIKTGVSKVVQGFRNLRQNIAASHKSSGGLQMSFKTLLKYGLGIRSMYILFRKLRQAVIDAVKTLAQFKGGNNELNKNLSLLMSSLAQLKNAFGAAFVPLINVVTPILNSFIEKLIEVADAVGMLMAKLTGQSTYMKAKKVQKDFADSISGTGKAAEKASKALGKYDELAVISSDSGSGAGALTPEQQFEEVEVKETALSKTLEKFFKPFKDSWNTYGQSVIDAWQGALVAVNTLAQDILKTFMQVWTGGSGEAVLGDLLVLAADLGKWVESIATAFDKAWTEGDRGKALFQGFFDMLDQILGLFHDINEDAREVWDEGFGKQIFADTLEILTNIENTVKNITANFREAWNEGDRGKSIINDINNIILILSGGIKEISQSLADWAGTLDFGPLLESIDTLMVKLSPLIEDIKEVGVWLFTDILEPIGKWFIEGAGPAILDFIGSVASLVGVTIDVLKPFADWLWNNLLQPLADWAGGALTDIVEGVSEFIQALADFTSGAISPEEFANIGISLVDGLLMGILEACTGLWEWLKTNLVDPIWTACCDLFKTGSPSKLFEQLGEWLIEGLIQGISDMIDKVKQVLGDIKDAVVQKWNKMGEAIKKRTSKMKEKIVENWDNLKEKTSDAFTKIKEKSAEIWDNIKQNTSEKVKDIKEKVVGVFSKIKNKILDKMSGLKESVGKIWTDIKNAMKTPINAMLGFIEKFLNGIVGAVNKITEFLNKLRIDIPDWIPEVGGKSIGFDFSPLKEVKLPRLAQGAVIPPNKEFAAILGDQKSGTNIETPLDTMIEAFRTVMEEFMSSSQGSAPIVLQLNGKQIAKAVWDEDAKRYKQSGGSAYGY